MARPKSDIEPRIIEAARRLFLTDGVDGASLRRIAREAGTSIGMIYYYFPTKDDLFLGVVEDVYGELLRDLSGALSHDTSVEERIHRLYQRIGAMSDEEFMVMRIVIREALVSADRLERIVERFARGHLPLIAATVAEGVQDGTLTGRYPFPVLIIAMGTLGIMPQILLRRATDERTQLPVGVLPRPEELADRLVDVLLHGIGGARDPGASTED